MVNAFLFLSLALSTLTFASVTKSAKVDKIHLEDSGNEFSSLDYRYTAEESFVFTTVAHFDSGQACGLAIGGTYDHYWVFNIDRVENRTKLLYFTRDQYGYHAKEHHSDYLIGNSQMTSSELEVIRPKLNACQEFHLKLVVTIDGDRAYAEFFVDNIKRFGVDEHINLNGFLDGSSYQGGGLGFNVFNASVTFDNTYVGNSDYVYYSEPYRNQYHYSQYAHWNNDPNGLVYYKGWYHMYYQTHPYSKYWDHMYWGHARSRDLVHWQELPYALFPDSMGYAWSGIAMAYHRGMSDSVDGQGWFPNGSGDGLIGYYTRDGKDGQDQIIITSDDGGTTWSKQREIPQRLIFSQHKIDCRDPSIFPLKKEHDKVTLWGMILSGGTQNQFWFLKSQDMLDWDYAGGYNYVYPECMSVHPIVADDGTFRQVISVSSRYYAVGNLIYDDVEGRIRFILADGRDYGEVGQSAFVKMDYAEDSYAAQSFNIDDETSEYYGKAISISWYSGLPSDAESGIYAEVRHPWNGGGMTIPVELGLKKEGNGYYLTQTPITKNNENFGKTPLVNENNLVFDGESNPLEPVNTHTFELAAEIENPSQKPVEFRINGGENEYTAFGWNKEDGYYFDRRFTSDAGIHFQKNYHHKFTAEPCDGEHLSFYVLSDNGGVEIFTDDDRYAFYGLTLASPASNAASIVSGGPITFTSLNVNEISSIWHEMPLEEGVLYADQDEIQMDLSLSDSKELQVYASNKEEIQYEVQQEENVIAITPTARGVSVKALANGDADIIASIEGQSKTVHVHVEEADVSCGFDLKKENIVSGKWRKSNAGLVGEQKYGDGYLLSDEEMSYFNMTAKINLSNAAAAGLVIFAQKDMSDYLVCNVDKAAKVCKIFSPRGVIASTSIDPLANDIANYGVQCEDRHLTIYLNGKSILSTTLPSTVPEAGFIGLNVFSGTVVFEEVTLAQDDYVYESGDFHFENTGNQYIKAIYNIDEKNALVQRGYWKVEDGEVIISETYMKLLDSNKSYRFFVEGEEVSYTIHVAVKEIQKTVQFADKVLNEGLDAVIYIGRMDIVSVELGGVTLPSSSYQVKDFTLVINKDVLSIGDNEVLINGEHRFNIQVKPLKTEADNQNDPLAPLPSGTSVWTYSGPAIGLGLGLLAIAIAAICLIKAKRS